jgi:hypothetical protein
MACFLVPTAEAIVTTVVASRVKRNAKEGVEISVANAKPSKFTSSGKFTWKTKLSWLNSMLWGGAILLCLEHIWHGEVIFYPPFLTAMNNPGNASEMLHEMGTVGVGMAILITVAWLGIILIADHSKAIKTAFSEQKA